ncbi:MAG: hypothetical protein LBH00_10570 [Planctomycetaceae bacterium]|jgi:hypothetical protein|nr:hypothetical protein [Planctomycetaceae bacterium]
MKNIFIVAVIVFMLFVSAYDVCAATYDFSDFYDKLKSDEYYSVEVEIALFLGTEGIAQPSGRVSAINYPVVYYNATGNRTLSITNGAVLQTLQYTAGFEVKGLHPFINNADFSSGINPALNFPASSYSLAFGFDFPEFAYLAHSSGRGISLPQNLFDDNNVNGSLVIGFNGNVFKVDKIFLARYKGWYDASVPVAVPLGNLTVPYNVITGGRYLFYRFNIKIPNEKGILRFLDPNDSCICGALCHHCCNCGWWNDVTDNERTGRSPHECAEKKPSECDHEPDGLLPGKDYCPYCCPCHDNDGDDGDGGGDDDDDDGGTDGGGTGGTGKIPTFRTKSWNNLNFPFEVEFYKFPAFDLPNNLTMPEFVLPDRITGGFGELKEAFGAKLGMGLLTDMLQPALGEAWLFCIYSPRIDLGIFVVEPMGGCLDFNELAQEQWVFLLRQFLLFVVVIFFVSAIFVTLRQY